LHGKDIYPIFVRQSGRQGSQPEKTKTMNTAQLTQQITILAKEENITFVEACQAMQENRY
jgi:hypothetical protein